MKFAQYIVNYANGSIIFSITVLNFTANINTA